MLIYSTIKEFKAAGRKSFALLVDPDGHDATYFEHVARLGMDAGIDFFFVGGSLIADDVLELCLSVIRSRTKIPVIIFPGSSLQINPNADAILFLSLISGRNAEMLIGRQVTAAPYLRKSGLEVISTGYMLIDSGKSTTALYMSNTLPIPGDKPQIAACTAMAGAMLGLSLIYLDGGSGAANPVSIAIISAVKEVVEVPIIVGGGIRTPQQAIDACSAGADVIVVGNAAEKDPGLLRGLVEAVHNC
ncbi:MAG TPA: geranylgeranylglyceryl/heptaprenylglyceryl phosphate synthase [Bacteroidales bacterium]|nr:MAG: geranylgeranylglyceryl/heptaprenylglyceryl phosphate synthase [Bacteroidetes bacterium GWE2_42_24]OFY28365.1 MAG: geranylgeranylglyceryl/heptaprenylglyceryl phosphate synthase [Bacteroidetes bacterium GWF2_43_11]HAQ65194.1 geranylgeranylglyceryl/heptaprenylglyceryl phosphate synthase [Bacteroidales bacterium]HBZ65799.1 geranylgeranylglyceryl/heptaprenylglyceryl phosphate synthase [Bacteroidales bacterium]